MVAMLLFMSGLPGSSQEPTDEWLSVFLRTGSEAEMSGSFAELLNKADTTVLGTITAVGAGRSAGDAGAYALATLSVEEVLLGAPHRQASDLELDVEFFMTNRDQLDTVRQVIKGESGVFVLRNKGTEAEMLGYPPARQSDERRYYRLVSTQGLFREVGGKVRTSPHIDDPFIKDRDGVPFEDFVQSIRDRR